jgi:hypothetical protein
MASEVLFTIWQGGWRDTPKRTTLGLVKTIVGANWPPAMPLPAGSLLLCEWKRNTSEPGGRALKQALQSLEISTFFYKIFVLSGSLMKL